MGIVQRKDKMTEAVSGEKIFVPSPEDFLQDPPQMREASQEQFPPVDGEPYVTVGIMSTSEIHFRFVGEYRCCATNEVYTGEHIGVRTGHKIKFDNQLFDELLFEPLNTASSVFELVDVTIGVGFHWERKENQQFKGALKLMVEAGKLTAINRILVEDYLYCVIASEMSAKASLELLKAHAVISRSWLLAPMLNGNVTKGMAVNESHTETELIKWYERDAHLHFDVCADDHCQRYQGVTRACTPLVKTAIEATRGEVLMYDNQICDARFSKSCGGVSELFENCWAPEHYDYLTPIVDYPTTPEGYDMDLTKEVNADRWIRTAPQAFCNTTDKKILEQVLNNYDQETTDFYRWKVVYTQTELSALIRKRSGIDFGVITDLIPIERGTSGRLIKLKIVGTLKTLTVGKELEIRKWLSESHLYSSAFVVDKTADGTFILIGAGWGHGVGLCQIGAAVMGEKGYKYDAILKHYFRGASLEKKY
jgi:SpoIID/LytB domain protein